MVGRDKPFNPKTNLLLDNRLETTATGPVLEHVKGRMSTMRPAEIKVAQLMVDHADDFYRWSITEVAERAAVSEATVIRMAKVLGFSGLQELKISLAQERAVQHEMVEAASNDDWSTAAMKLEKQYHEMIQASVRITQTESFASVLQAIRESPHVLLLGAGTSAITAQFLQYKLSRIGIRSTCHLDGHFQALAAINLVPKDVAIAFSVSGSTVDTVDALALAKEAGATTVAITHNPRSPITRHADQVLISQGFDSPVLSNSLLAHGSQMFLIDALYLELVLGNYTNVVAHMERAALAIARFKKY